MMGITGVCSRLVQALKVAASSPSNSMEANTLCSQQDNASQADDLMMIRALTAVFGMENNGRIKKEKARRVMEKLGMLYPDEEEEQNPASFDDELPVEEVLGGLEDEPEHQHELLQEAFKVFDEDGNGYIEAMELKRVLQCLGLDKGWEMSDIEKMLKAADLNFDGKVDFSEFELMMS